jgi:hypothetical protein
LVQLVYLVDMVQQARTNVTIGMMMDYADDCVDMHYVSNDLHGQTHQDPEKIQNTAMEQLVGDAPTVVQVRVVG